MKQAFQPVVRQCRQIFSVILCSKVGEPNLTELTEHELIEAMMLTEAVVIGRLKGNPDEWKGDDKRHYSTLFNSIKMESIDAIRSHFVLDGKQQSGITLNKFNTLVIDVLFELLANAGPDRAPHLVTTIRKALARDLKNHLKTPEEDGSHARTLLAQYSKDRARRICNPTKLSKADRLSLIEAMVLRLQPAH